MTGEELKQTVKRSGMSVTDFARELGMSPQNLNGKFGQKSIKTDLLDKINAIIDKCCPPLPAEMEASVMSSNINGSNSSNVRQSIGDTVALQRENDVLRQQNEFLQKQVERLMALLEK